MIEAPFGAPPMALARRRPRRGVPRCDTSTSNRRGRDHTRHKSRKADCSVDRFSGEAACPPRRSGARFDWTRRVNRCTRETTGSVRRSIEAVTRVCRISSRPSPRPRRPQLTVTTDTKRLWTLTHPWTHRTRPPLLGNLAEEREIPTSVHSPFLFFRKNKDEEPTTTAVQIYAVSGER